MRPASSRSAARERGGGLLIPVDSEHSALFQCAQLGDPGERRPDGERRALPRPHARRARRRHAEQALAHPTWSMGAKITIDSATLANKGLEVIEAHFLFGVPYDRIEVVVHPTSIVHGLVRFRDGASIAHLGYPDMRVPISYRADVSRSAPATPVPSLDLTRGSARVLRAGCRRRSRMLALAREAGERGGTYPVRLQRRERGRGRRVPRRPDRVPRDRGARRGCARARRRRAGARPRRAARGRPAVARELAAAHGADMGLVAAIVGLALLVMIHEAGHFFAARAVGMTPRKFYIGFGPPIAKKARGGVEYGIGSIPLGGYVKIPGMNRPSPGDLARAAARRSSARRHEAELQRLDAAIERGDDDSGARGARPSCSPQLGRSRVWQELEWSLAPDAYWRQATWRRLVAIGAGPAVNLVFAVRAVHRALPRRLDARLERDRPRASRARRLRRLGLRAGDRIVLRVAGGRPCLRQEIPAHIRATAAAGRSGSSSCRDGRRVDDRAAAREADRQGAYRIGIAIESRTGAGRVAAGGGRDSVRLTWSSSPTPCAGSATWRRAATRNRSPSSVGHRARVRPGVAPGGSATSCSCSAWSASRSAC